MRQALLLAAIAAWGAAGQEKFDLKAHYQKAEYKIPMRDGVRLHTTVYRPRKNTEKLPFLLVRTPYGTGPYGENQYRAHLGPSPHSFEFEREGFLFVFQDVRGKFQSEGEFTVMRLHKWGKTGTETDESSDTYDTIEWLLKNIPGHNGQVGQYGTSYPGFQTVHGMLEAHPAMKAVAPMASPSDMFIGDDFHHHGAFRLAYTFGWLSANARVRKGPNEKDSYRFDPGTPDGYKWFLELGPLSNVNRLHFLGQVPEWNAYMEHPNYDEFWQRQNVLSYVKDVRIPVLNVAGWFDAEDFYGPMTIYEQIEKTTPHNQSTLVVGPWSHGGWNSSPDGNQLGAVKFAGAPAKYFRERVQFPFFLYHLKGKGKLELPEALVYESGLNEWRSYEQWPPVTRTAERRLYLRAAGRLAWEPPEEPGEAYDSYVSDPAKPVPYTAEIRFSQGHNWMVEDQRFAARRPDVLVYRSEELAEDVTLAGRLIARLWASTAGTDADYMVKLIDEFPGNAPDNQGHYQMLVSGEVFRAKYRKSFSRPEPMQPGEPELITIDLRDKNHRFKKGHRIVVQVQSSWFPIIDRNPQKFVNIYQATEADYQKAEQRVWRSREQPTHLEVSVLR